MGFVFQWSNEIHSTNDLDFCRLDFQGYHRVVQTVYYEEFEKNCQLIRQYVSSKEVPSDFIPNAYAYILHVNTFSLFIPSDLFIFRLFSVEQMINKVDIVN